MIGALLYTLYFLLSKSYTYTTQNSALSLKTWNEAITLSASWQDVLNEGGWKPWSTIKARPLWSLWFLFTEACAGPVAVNPELPTMQGSATLRIFLMEEMKCCKRVKQSHANSAIMIPVADQFKLICQDGQRRHCLLLSRCCAHSHKRIIFHSSLLFPMHGTL